MCTSKQNGKILTSIKKLFINLHLKTFISGYLVFAFLTHLTLNDFAIIIGHSV